MLIEYIFEDPSTKQQAIKTPLELNSFFNSSEKTLEELATEFNVFLTNSKIDSLTLCNEETLCNISNINFIDNPDDSKIEKLMRLLPLLPSIKNFSCFINFSSESRQDTQFIELLNQAIRNKRDLSSLTLSQVGDENHSISFEAFDKIADSVNTWNLKSLNINYYVDQDKIQATEEDVQEEASGAMEDESDSTLSINGPLRLLENLKFNTSIEKLDLQGILGSDERMVAKFSEMIMRSRCLTELNLGILSMNDENLTPIFSALLSHPSIKIFNCNYSVSDDIGFSGCLIGDTAKKAFIDLINSNSLSKIAIGFDEDLDLEGWSQEVFEAVKNSALEDFKSNIITDQERRDELSKRFEENKSLKRPRTLVEDHTSSKKAKTSDYRSEI